MATYIVIILLMLADAFFGISGSGEHNISAWLLIYQLRPAMSLLNFLFGISGFSFYLSILVGLFINCIFLFILGVIIGYVKREKA